MYGYGQSEIGELVINEEQAEVVRKVFDLYLSGYSINMIMKELAFNNIKSSTGKDIWSKRTIQKMLTNEKYIGNVILGKTYTGQFPNTQQKINYGEQEQYLMKDSHEPIIINEVFQKVQEEMKSRSNIEVVNGKTKRKGTHYSSKDIERQDTN